MRRCLRIPLAPFAAPLIPGGPPQRPLSPLSASSSHTENNKRWTTLFTSMREMSSLNQQEGAPPYSAEHRTLGSMGGEDFTKVFNSRPVAERAAAMLIARRHPHDGGVTLRTFVEELPKLSRDDIFQRGIRVEEWVRESALLHLVEDADGVCRVALAADAKCFLADEASDVVRETTEVIQEETSVKVQRDRAEANEQLLHILRDNVLGLRGAGESNYKPLNEAYSSLLREASRHAALRGVANTLRYVEFLDMLKSPCGVEEFWVLHEKYICTRNPAETHPPRFVSPQPQTMVAHALNAYGGWGAASNVPTRQDVYEILKYVPVNWGNFGNLNLPAAIKKRHIRIASTLQWFRRQPFYFELRSVTGTVEIRRSIVLHPEIYGLTPEEAHEQLQLKMARGEANSLVPVNAEGELVTAVESSQHTVALMKFVLRVCPGYFVPPSLLMQRYTKKNLTSGELVACAKGHPENFEVLQLKYTDVPLLRKRTGADSTRWKDGFAEDFERYPEDVRGLVVLMGRMCSTWDRPHYVYVRLTEVEKAIVGGFDGMMQMLRRHPQVFRLGENFIARLDLSDPLSLREPEPKPDDMATRVVIREENPYQTPRDLAVVFHYVAPEDEPCTAAFFLQCASPAMRAVLPPRFVTVLQLFPDLFACKETSPGVFLTRKVKRTGRRPAGAFGTDPRGEGGDAPTSPQRKPNDEEAEETLDLEAEFAENDFMSREEAVQAVRSLVPPGGVEASQLLLWASIGVQQAANRHFGGVLKLVEANRAHFRVQESQETKMIYPAGV